MRLVFAGTPAFAAIALDALVDAGFEIALVLTQPDRPAGRGLHAQASAVKLRAVERGLTLAQPATLKDAAIVQHLQSTGADAMIVAAYGLILPAAVLQIPPRGCLNIHASLLPRWRGAAPIQRAILAGDAETGITIMQMDEGLDTGDILLQERVAIADDDTTQSLHDKLAVTGAGAIIKALRTSTQRLRQDNASATYAAKISKDEARIDWQVDARAICRQIRAYNPAPGASTQVNGTMHKIWSARSTAEQAAAGMVIRAGEHGILVGAGSGSVLITELQRAGGKRLKAREYLAGIKVLPDSQWGA